MRAAGQWQRLAETVANTIRPFDGLRIPAADFQPAITALLQQQRLAENLLRGVRPLDDLHERLMATVTWQPQLDVFREFARRFPTLGLPTRWLPPNWFELADLDIDVAMDIVVNECVPLAWVPHPKLVAEIVAAADANERDKILASSHENIAEHCLAVLDEISAPDLKPLAELAVGCVFFKGVILG
ncbi:hypothetical protein KBI5_21955 [Frankia sp. KB5]|nr:hypothetical protein KBI5_21955 [Frankia sp. KB5]